MRDDALQTHPAWRAKYILYDAADDHKPDPAERTRASAWDRIKKGQFVERNEGEITGAPIPVRANMELASAFLAVGIFQFFLLPILLIPLSAWWALLLVPCALTTTTNWAVIHEAIHFLLSPDRRSNDYCGRSLAIMFGSPLALLRFLHLEHHRLNGTVADRPEHYQSTRLTRLRAALHYYPNLLIGIYVAELTATFICLLPLSVVRRMTSLVPMAQGEQSRAELLLLQPKRLWQLRRDAFAVVVLYALAFWCYGPYWPLLGLSIFARCVLVSVSDNSYHYGAPLGAGARSAFNLKLPASAGILHFNLHRVHHLHPSLPWSALPQAFEADGENFDLSYIPAIGRQFRGPISDQEYAKAS